MSDLLQPFVHLIPAPTVEARQGLEESLVRHGCIDRLVVWKDHGVLLDGHNRLEICTRLGIPWESREIELPDEDAAREWVLRHALARRNLTPVQASYLRGKLLEARKAQGQRGDRTSHQIDGKSEPKLTARAIGAEHGVSQATVERDGRFVRDLDKIERTAGREVVDEVLSGRVHATQADIHRIAQAGVKSVAELRERIADEQASRKAAKSTPIAEAGAFRQSTVVSYELTADPDTGEELVDAYVLLCGHTQKTKRRVTPDRVTKTARCEVCCPTTRTSAERARRAATLRQGLKEALIDDKRFEAVLQLVESAILMCSLDPRDARAGELRDRVTTCAREARLVGKAA